MNEYVVTFLAILGTLAVGFALLVRFGVSEVAYFGIAVLLLAIFGSIFYTWWKTQTDKTINKLKVEILMKVRDDYWMARRLMEDAQDLVSMEDILQNMDAIKEGLVGQKLYSRDMKKIERTVEKMTLTSIEQESRRVEQRLVSLEALAVSSYRPSLEKYVEELRGNLRRLEDAGYTIGERVSEFNIKAGKTAKGLRELIEKKKEVTEDYQDIVAQCVREATELSAMARKFGDVTAIDEMIARARGGGPEAVETLIEVRGKLREIVSDVFARQLNKLIQNLEKITKVLDSEHVAPRDRDEIAGILAYVKAFEDPGLLVELQRHETKFKNMVSAIIQKLDTRLHSLASDIKAQELSSKLWKEDPEIPALIEAVDVRHPLDRFTEASRVALEHILAQLDEDKAFMKIMENYPKVEPIIAQQLRDRKEVGPGDLTIKYADRFLTLYHLKNPGTKLVRGKLKVG
ncbi:MAG: hypothetical protein GXO65_01180 [Euryarchaeota archaeon]|nr:hypothetical protein [Euryarchaeota archaeon]